MRSSAVQVAEAPRGFERPGTTVITHDTPQVVVSTLHPSWQTTTLLFACMITTNPVAGIEQMGLGAGLERDLYKGYSSSGGVWVVWNVSNMGLRGLENY